VAFSARKGPLDTLVRGNRRFQAAAVAILGPSNPSP